MNRYDCRECVSLSSCSWCRVQSTGTPIDQPYCIDISECYWGIKDFHPGTDTHDKEPDSGGVGVGPIVGIVIVVIILIVAAIIGGYFYINRRKNIQLQRKQTLTVANSVLASMVTPSGSPRSSTPRSSIPYSINYQREKMPVPEDPYPPSPPVDVPPSPHYTGTPPTESPDSLYLRPKSDNLYEDIDTSPYNHNRPPRGMDNPVFQN